jgi:hypothetical protein
MSGRIWVLRFKRQSSPSSMPQTTTRRDYEARAFQLIM